MRCRSHDARKAVVDDVGVGGTERRFICASNPASCEHIGALVGAVEAPINKLLVCWADVSLPDASCASSRRSRLLPVLAVFMMHLVWVSTASIDGPRRTSGDTGRDREWLHSGLRGQITQVELGEYSYGLAPAVPTRSASPILYTCLRRKLFASYGLITGLYVTCWLGLQLNRDYLVHADQV